MDYKTHLDNMTASQVVSAQKALDYLDGNQIPHMEEVLTAAGGIKQWRERGVKIVVENLTRKIIERSALSYQEEPKREVFRGEVIDEAATDRLAEILHESNLDMAVEDADQVARLLRVCIVLCQYVDETDELIFSVLHRGNSDVHYDHKTGQILSLFYTAGAPGPTGGRLFHQWKKDRLIDVEVYSDGGSKVVGGEPHPYGIIPAAVLWDMRRPRAGFWPKPAWEELIALNEGVNLFHTETKFGARYQSLAPLFTNGKIAEGQVVGPDTTVEIDVSPGETPFIQYAAPKVNLEEFNAWLSGFQESVADGWGVNLKASGNADSGFKLTVEEIWNLETRKKRLKSARDFERRMFEVIQKISDAHGLGIPSDGILYPDFPEPSLPVNEQEKWTIVKEQIATKVLSREQYWRKEDPDLTDEDIEARKREIDGAKLPDFSGQVDGV